MGVLPIASDYCDIHVNDLKLWCNGHRPLLKGMDTRKRVSHRLRGQVQHVDYTASLKLKVKVLDFIKSSPPDLIESRSFALTFKLAV